MFKMTWRGPRVVLSAALAAALLAGCRDSPAGPAQSAMLAVVDVDGLGSNGPGLAVVRYDGTGYRWLAAPADDPAWLAGGDELVYWGVRAPGDGTRESHAYVVDLDGNVRRLVPAAAGLAGETWPKPSRDGAWVYFTGARPGEAGTIWRIHPDGTALERIGPDADPSNPVRLLAVSPDGQSLIVTPGQNAALAVLDVPTRTLRNLPFAASGDVAFSPSGAELALVVNGAVHVARPDGSQDRQVSHPLEATSYQDGLAWSSDGRYLVARALGGLHQIEVSSGRTVPLALSGAFYKPAWRPR